VKFLAVYIREAHPQDEWSMNLAGKLMSSGLYPTDVYQPTSLEERRAVASRCESAMEYGMSTVVDDIDNRVSIAYNALPTRLYLIGVDGHVVYPGAPGPFGYSPNELAKEIEAYLDKAS
jgi:hypothetical protein